MNDRDKRLVQAKIDHLRYGIGALETIGTRNQEDRAYGDAVRVILDAVAALDRLMQAGNREVAS